MAIKHNVREVLKNAACIFTKAEIETALDRMATALKARVGESNPVFVCVLVGGIIPMGNLLTRLDFPLEIDYVHVSRYGDQTQGGELNWKATPALDLTNRTVVVVDDILDEGLTLAPVVAYCKSHGAREVITAVLVDKKKPRSAKGLQEADVSGLQVDDQFVFGYGLDYHSYLRNAPGIYVAAPQHR